MKILKIALSLLLAATSALAQGVDTEVVSNSSGTRVLRTRDKQWLWGFGASTPTTFLSENIPIGAAFFNTSTGVVYYHSGSAWVSSASSITPGTSTVTGCTDMFLFANASSLLDCDAAFVADDSGAGNGIMTVRKTNSGAAATSNFFRSAGTFTAGAATLKGAAFSYTTATTTQQTHGLAVALLAGNASTGVSAATFVENSMAGTNATAALSFGGNIGQYTAAQGTGSVVTNTSHWAQALGATNNFVYLGTATSGTGSAASNVAGYFFAHAASSTNIALVAVRGSSAPTLTGINAAILADNQANAHPIAIFRDNGAAVPTTGATATTTIGDGGWLQNGNAVLTNATMTAETQARNSGSQIHSYTWSNAQVVALGANLTGDITVATLPAKTQLRNAYVVITGAAAGPATVTVSCGDAVAGTPFINYIVPSDAKAAANTVYGDAVAERGTSIDLEWYYMPSYTGTVLVTCHFISTVANLDQVTGSTGRVILETSLLP